MASNFSRSELVKYLSEGYCTVTFTKVSGESRTMVCTRSVTLIPDADSPISGEADPGYGPLRVYEKCSDGAGQWRSFYPSEVKSFQLGTL